MSTILLLKSQENFALSKKIVTEKKGFYSSSIHSSYYSCVQLMLHIIRSDFGKTELEIENESKIGSDTEGGFHNWIINIISREFFLRNFFESRDFQNKVNELKGIRIKSDYKNIEINEKKAIMAFDYALIINNSLKKYFKI